MSIKPWYNVVTPREDLRENKPLDASEFAVHLDQVRDQRAPSVYQKPELFFERTFLTRGLTDFAAEAMRRLAGIKTGSSAVFNLATQFGGGKTHALTLLYHLAKNGRAADRWQGVPRILEKAGLGTIPEANVAVFVGTEFDSLTGRGGDDGTPHRRTPWGEIAYQLGGPAALALLAQHEAEFIEPKGDVIRAFLPKDKPALILLDEIINYASTYRTKGYGDRLYNFIQALSETARGQDNVVLVVSIPASELEYTAQDEADETRFKKMLDRVGKAVMMSAEAETYEIIRRRLFEWDPRAINQDGRVLLNRDAQTTCSEYAGWVLAHRQQLPDSFPIDHAQTAFEAAYPFHPMTLSVFERKWQALPRFQRTRGVLRLMALWVAKAYQDGYKGAHRDPLISLGTAPLDESLFRAAVFEQLNESRLEAVVTTDICGKVDSHAVALDLEAVDTIRKARLHRKVAATIFFESNGGQSGDKHQATIPEIRLAVAEPDLDIGNIETVLEALTERCYFLLVDRNRYHFSLRENLNKRFADRRASIDAARIHETVQAQVQKDFALGGPVVERFYFPERSNQVADRPVLTLSVISPERGLADSRTLEWLDAMTREAGTSSRTFKSALLWAVADSDTLLREEARKLLAWEDINDDQSLNLDEVQSKQLVENVKKARRDLKEAVWRSYKNLVLLGKNNTLRVIDLGLINSSAADSLITYYLNRLRQEGDFEKDISPNFLLRNWSPAFTEWSTKAVRDAFYASPQFPRLANPDAIKVTIARGVSEGLLGYVGKTPDGKYSPFLYKKQMGSADVEISDDVFLVTRETAEAYHIAQQEPPRLTALLISPSTTELQPGKQQAYTVRGLDQRGAEYKLSKIDWTATGGTMNVQGVFTAGDAEGNFTVTAQSGDVSNTATVRIAKTITPPPPQPPPQSSGAQTISWTGQVPAQKWMNFYTKVLSRFASSQDLKLTVTFRVTISDPAGAAKAEETRSALKELGLNDDVQIQ